MKTSPALPALPPLPGKVRQAVARITGLPGKFPGRLRKKLAGFEKTIEKFRQRRLQG